MPIDPIAGKSTPNLDRQRLNSGAVNQAAIAQQRNKGQQGAAMRAKPTSMAKPNIGQPAVPLGVNKKKPVLAPGSVRANAMRESLGNRDMDMRNQALQAQQAQSAMQAAQGNLAVGPSQLPFMPPDTDMGNQDMGMSQYDPMAVQNSNMLADQLAMQAPGGQIGVGPSQLPFNPNAGIAGPNDRYTQIQQNDPRGSMPGQFGPVNPAVQQNMLRNRMQQMQQMDAQRRQMSLNRSRGGY